MMFPPALSAHNPKRRSAKPFFANSTHSPFFKPVPNNKVTVNETSNIGEHEADAISEQVMRMPANETSAAINNEHHRPVTSAQKSNPDNQKEEELELDQEDAQPLIPNSRMKTEVGLSQGQPIKSDTKRFMETAFSYDFSDVQIHDDPLSHQSAADISALAYTFGNHVAFAQNQYQPETTAGKKLLAHELTHVIQQSSNSNHVIQRAPETWFRGEGTGVAPSKPGGSVHDFGDGLYLTNSADVASQYADTRAASQKGSSPLVRSGSFERTELGRVLDLTQNAQWQSYLSSRPITNGDTIETLIRRGNENYWTFFNDFLKSNKLSLNNYDTIIGPEFVRGGTQACIRNPKIADRIMGVFRPFTPGAPAKQEEPKAQTTPGAAGSPGVPATSSYSTGTRVTAGAVLVLQGASLIAGKFSDDKQAELAREKIERLEKNFYALQANHPELGAWITVYWQVVGHGDAGSVRTFFDVSIQTGTTELQAKYAKITSALNLPESRYQETNSFWIPPAQPLPYAELPTPFPKIAIGTFAPSKKAQLQLAEWGGIMGFSGNGMFQLSPGKDSPALFAILKPPANVTFANGTMRQDVSIEIGSLPTSNNYNIPVVDDLKAALVSPLDEDTAVLFGLGVKGLEIKDHHQLMNLFAGTRWLPPNCINIVSITDAVEVADNDVYRQIALLSPNAQAILTEIISKGPKGLKFPMEWLKKFEAILPPDLTADEVKQLISKLKPVGSATLDDVLLGFQKAIAALPSRLPGGKSSTTGTPGQNGDGDGETDTGSAVPQEQGSLSGTDYARVAKSDDLLVDVPPADFAELTFALSMKTDLSKARVNGKVTVYLVLATKDDNSVIFEGIVETTILSMNKIDDQTTSYELQLTSPKAIDFRNVDGKVVKQLSTLVYEKHR
jgi:hypothetical protein